MFGGLLHKYLKLVDRSVGTAGTVGSRTNEIGKVGRELVTELLKILYCVLCLHDHFVTGLFPE